MKVYMRAFLLIFGALLLTNCASHQSEVEQSASVPTSVEEQVVANETPEELTVEKLAPELRDDEVVCKKEVVTGSKIPKREVCATRKQWADRTKVPREQWYHEMARKGYSS